jgi:type VI secretion system secreted protein Hcp
MAMDMFLVIDKIKGESQDSVHMEVIDVLAWSWGGSQSGTTHMGGGGGAGKVNIQDFSFTKYLDASSTTLFQHMCKGTHINEALLIVRKAGDTPLEYVKIKMIDIIVTSMSTGGSGGEDRLTENVTLNFSKFNVDYLKQDETGAGKAAGVALAWDIAANTVA